MVTGNPQDLNRYSYVRNNPVKYTDPTGHTPYLDAGGGGGDTNTISPIGILRQCRGSLTCEWTEGGQWLLAHPSYDPSADPWFGQHEGYQNILHMLAQIYLDSGQTETAIYYWSMAQGNVVDQAIVDSSLSLAQNGGGIVLSTWGVQRSFWGKLFGREHYLRSLPKWSQVNDPTHGILVVDGQEFSLRSGRGPATQMPLGASGYDGVTRTHVEGHAAAVMHQLQVNQATLYINNSPCTNCLRNLTYMLPEGSSLRVVGVVRETGAPFDQMFLSR